MEKGRTVKLYLAPTVTELTAFLGALPQGEKNLIFCEDRLTLEAERALTRAGGTVLDSAVTTFSRFLRGANGKKVLSKQGSVLVAGAVAAQNAEKLTCFGKNPAGCAGRLYETVAQLRAARIAPRTSSARRTNRATGRAARPILRQSCATWRSSTAATSPFCRAGTWTRAACSNSSPKPSVPLRSRIRTCILRAFPPLRGRRRRASAPPFRRRRASRACSSAARRNCTRTRRRATSSGCVLPRARAVSAFRCPPLSWRRRNFCAAGCSTPRSAPRSKRRGCTCTRARTRKTS